MRKFPTYITYTILLICLAKTQSVLSECTDEEWSCDNGSCISLDKKCNGFVDCADRSDEISENCIYLYQTCKDFAFACSYGACISRNDRCNGISDCADNSDEVGCRNTRKTELQGSCGPEKVQCLNSKECIAIENVCDGHRDCADETDETVEVCGDFECPKALFHCGNGGCINDNARCNGIIECSDGSDEAWELCGTPRKTVVKRKGRTTSEMTTSSPILTPTETPTPNSPTTPTSAVTVDNGGCQIPPSLKDASIKLHPVNVTISPGSWVEDEDTIHIECNSRSTSLICDKGKFNGEFPSCTTYCNASLLQGISTIYDCYHNGHYLTPEQCNKKIDSTIEIHIKCANGYKRSSGESIQKMRCLPNGTFDVEREKCNAVCGHVQLPDETLTRKGIKVYPSEVPWHIGIYSNLYGEYELLCSGSVISPTLIITAAHCFWDSVKRAPIPKESLKFIAGKYTRNYSTTGNEMPQIRDAAEMHISEDYLGKETAYNADVALFKLKEPLIYNDNISPVCIRLTEVAAADFVRPGQLGSISFYDHNNTLVQLPMKTKDFYSCLAHTVDGALAKDKFCLFNENDSISAYTGRSGSGFVVEETKENKVFHYLRGVLSNLPATQQEELLGVTDVRYLTADLKDKIKTEMQADTMIF